jgi:hypothetical protein
MVLASKADKRLPVDEGSARGAAAASYNSDKEEKEKEKGRGSRHQLINNNCNTKTLAAISDLHDRVEEVSEEDPDAETIETVREIAGLHLKLRSNPINQEETAQHDSQPTR